MTEVLRDRYTAMESLSPKYVAHLKRQLDGSLDGSGYDGWMSIDDGGGVPSSEMLVEIWG